MSVLSKIKKLFSSRNAKSVNSDMLTEEKTKEESKNMPEIDKKNGGEEKEEITPATTQEIENEETNESSKEQEAEQEDSGTVIDTDSTGNGIRIEDIALKADVQAAISAAMAKIEAVLKENEDLKQTLAKEQGEKEELRKKYEDGDFGNIATKGLPKNSKAPYQSYDEYSKQFM